MYFKDFTNLYQHDGQKTRWQVVYSFHDGPLTFLKLKDQDESIEPPMERHAVGVCINYFKQQANAFKFTNWRNQFETACQAASGNFAGLPEPIDFFYIKSNDREIQTANLDPKDPLFVYSYGNFDEVKPFPARFIRNENDLYKRIRKFMFDIGNILKTLNYNRLVFRQIQLKNLRFLVTSKKYIIGEFLSLCLMELSDHDPHHPHLVLKERFSAPECFSTNAALGPETDVYVLGKAILLFLGIRFKSDFPTPVELDEYFHFVNSKYKVNLRNDVIRALKIALQNDPKKRFRNIGEMVSMISGYFKPRPKRKPKPKYRGRL